MKKILAVLAVATVTGVMMYAAYQSRGYFALGGEALVPIAAAVYAFCSWKEKKNESK